MRTHFSSHTLEDDRPYPILFILIDSISRILHNNDFHNEFQDVTESKHFCELKKFATVVILLRTDHFVYADKSIQCSSVSIVRSGVFLSVIVQHISG